MAFVSKLFPTIILVSLATHALAQPSPTPVPPPPAGSGSGSGSGSGDVTIAKPAPDAPPEKVQEAKEVAKTAALTPIVPNPKDATRPAFQLYAEIDVPVVATGLVFAAARLVKAQAAYCAPLCDRATVNNPLDKLNLGYFSTGWSTASDIGLYSLVAGSGAVLFADEGLLPALNDGVVIIESAMSANAVASIMTLAAGRPRPFLYSETAPLSIRTSADAGLSFLSSHTSMSFAIVTSLYITEHRLHPHAAGPKWMLGIGLGVASFVAVARVMAGYHFITDVVGGAIVGSSMGVMISSIHPSPVTVVPIINKNENATTTGIGIQGSF